MKFLDLSNFSFCHNVFKSRLLLRHQKASICGKGFMYAQTLLRITFGIIIWFKAPPLFEYWAKNWLKSLMKHLNFYSIPQICSKRLWKHLGNHTEKPYKCWYSYWKELKTLWQKKKLLILNNFFLCPSVFKSRLLHRRQKASICGKGLNLLQHSTNLQQTPLKTSMSS